MHSFQQLDKADGVIRYAGAFKELHAAIILVGSLLERVINGLSVSSEQWSAAWAAAESATTAARIRQSEKLLELVAAAPVHAKV